MIAVALAVAAWDPVSMCPVVVCLLLAVVVVTLVWTASRLTVPRRHASSRAAAGQNDASCLPTDVLEHIALLAGRASAPDLRLACRATKRGASLAAGLCTDVDVTVLGVARALRALSFAAGADTPLCCTLTLRPDKSYEHVLVMTERSSRPNVLNDFAERVLRPALAEWGNNGSALLDVQVLSADEIVLGRAGLAITGCLPGLMALARTTWWRKHRGLCVTLRTSNTTTFLNLSRVSVTSGWGSNVTRDV